MIAGAAPVLLAALAGAAAALAVRELARAIPGLYEAAERVLEPLARAGREGRLPTDVERRNLGALLGIAGGAAVALVVGLGPAALAAAAGPALAAGWIGRRHRAYRRAVEDDIAALATALADALSAGNSLRTAVAECGAGFEGPTAAELARIGADLDLGLPVRHALGQLAERLGSEPVSALVRAALSQERTGGDLASLLRRHAAAAEDRRRSEADARAATSQARMTGGMVVAMPLVAALLVELVRPGFLPGLVGEPLAATLIAAALGLQLLGYLVIKRIGEVSR